MDEQQTATERWREAVERQILLGKSAGEATRAVVRRYPRLHQAFLAEVNASRGAGVEKQLARRFGEGGGES